MSYHEEIKILQDKAGLKICDLNALVSGLSDMAKGEFISYGYTVTDSDISLGFLSNYDFRNEAVIRIDTSTALISVYIEDKVILKVKLEDINEVDLIDKIVANATEDSVLARLFGTHQVVTSEVLLDNIRGVGLGDSVKEVVEVVKSLSHSQFQKFNKALEGLRVFNHNVYSTNKLFLSKVEVAFASNRCLITYSLHRYMEDEAILHVIFDYNMETNSSELNIATPDTSEVLCFKTSRSLAYFVASAERGLAGILSDK